ncbi:MAG: hypothetical protein WD872_00710 [Pirellulaceae bacterium]
MRLIEFQRDVDFETEEHRSRRESGWMGGAFVELPYFLSCLTRINFERVPVEVWEPAAREFITKEASRASWITRSPYFQEFAVLILRECYRQSCLGHRFPIRAENRQERSTRFVLEHPHLTIEEISQRLNTTDKQLHRNSMLMLALREHDRCATAAPNAGR